MRVTNWRNKAIATMAASGALAIAGVETANAQSTLIFDGNPLGNNGTLAGSGYGDNLPGTPNVTLDWGTGWENYLNWDGRTDVGQLDYNVAGSNVIDLTFNPDGGFGVYLTSFDLDTWSGGGNQDIFWEVLNGSDVVDSGSYLNPGGAGNRETFTTNMSAASAVFGALTLRFTQNDGLPNYIAADNISFAQVPEPTSAALLIGGLGALALRRRKS